MHSMVAQREGTRDACPISAPRSKREGEGTVKIYFAVPCR
jgi:hypothetical protein